MEKLTLEHISPYFDNDLKFLNQKTGAVNALTGLKIEFLGKTKQLIMLLDTEDYYYLHCWGQYLKPILYPMDLTKPIQVEGKEIVPIVELYNISQGIYYSPKYHHIDIMATDWVCIDKKGHWLYNFKIFKPENDIRLNTGYGFELFTTDLRNENKKSFPVNNQNLIFQWLFKHKFDVFGLIEKGLAIDVNTLETDPYANR